MGGFIRNCPRSCIWRLVILILVCVGASEYKFDRLLKAIDDLCAKGTLDGNEVVAQIGYTDYVPQNYTFFNLIGRDEFQKYMESADLIITHAGTGSVIPPLKLGKKIIVFPRLEKYNEHLDNHQLELRDVFTKAGYTLSAENEEELENAIKTISTFSPKKFESNNVKINNMICKFIDNL